MPFGLMNAPATFQLFMGIILITFKWQNALVCLGDIVVFSKTPSDYTEHTGLLLRFLKDPCITLDLQKYAFSIIQIDY